MNSFQIALAVVLLISVVRTTFLPVIVDDEPQLTQSSNYLINSNKIGLGYDPVKGTVVCFSGSCQAEGFGMQIFDLKFTKTDPGSCTSKMIPQGVDIDCLPSTSIESKTEQISSLESLKKSMDKGISASLGGSGYGASASFSKSKETRERVESLIENDETTFYSYADVSLYKLSLDTNGVQLSENFRAHVKSLPTDSFDNMVTKYYYNSFIEKFGFTFVDQILLGGREQQMIQIKNQKKDQLEQKGVDTSFQASVAFKISAGVKKTTSYDQQKHNSFTSSASISQATTLGGNSVLTSDITEWSKTVESNPVVTWMNVRHIAELFTSRYFPEDPLIATQFSLILKAVAAYTGGIGLIPCPQNCSGKGTCVDSGFFMQGICKCNDVWRGKDCSDIADAASIVYNVRMAGKGWSGWNYNGSVAGTVGEKRQLEDIQIQMEAPGIIFDVVYRIHVAGAGWLGWVSNGQSANFGLNRRIEAIQIQLAGQNSEKYKIKYTAHVAEYGWLNEMEDGLTAGTTGQSRRMEAIKIRIVQQ